MRYFDFSYLVLKIVAVRFSSITRWLSLLLVSSLVVYFCFLFFKSDSSNFTSSSEVEVLDELKKTQSDRLRISLLLRLQEIRSSQKNMSEVIRLSRDIRRLAGPLGDSLSIAKSLSPIRGEVDYQEQKLMMPFFPGAINAFLAQKDQYGAARLSSSYGAILLHSGKALAAQKHLLFALRTLEKLDSLRNCINVAINLGSSYQILGSNRMSFNYNEKAIQLATRFKDTTGLASGLMNRGTYYNDVTKEYTKAIQTFSEVDKIIPAHAGYLRAMNQYNLATAYLKAKKIELAEPIFSDLLILFTKEGATEGVAMVEKGLGDLYLLQGKPLEAKKHLVASVQLFDQMQLDIESLKSRILLRDVYSQIGNFQEAHSLSLVIEKLNDQIFSAEKAKTFGEMSEKYASEKKQLQIQKLESESIYQRLGILISLILAVVFFFLFRYQRRIVREKRLSYSVLMKQYRLEQTKGQTERLTADETQDLCDQLWQYYVQEKPYLDAKLKANTVAKHLHVRARDISALLKKKGYNGFNEFTNRFRVEEVKSRLADPRLAHLKIESIGVDSGFGSKQSFYSAFEEFTGLNPKYYREEILKA